MILSDNAIRRHLEQGTLKIGPLGDESLQIQPCSVDLRLGYEFKVFPPASRDTRWRPVIEPKIDPLQTDAAALMEVIHLQQGDAFELSPGSFALGCTLEKVCLPDFLLGRVDGRSSIGRLGILIHATAGLIDPGFEGILTLELANIGPYPVILTLGMRICQISFEALDQRCARPYGRRDGSKYQDQTGATASRIHLDGDSRKEL